MAQSRVRNHADYLLNTAIYLATISIKSFKKIVLPPKKNFMEKLKARNRQLEAENSILKSELTKYGNFSKRMVEIAAEMDLMLSHRTGEIEKLEQEIKSTMPVKEIECSANSTNSTNVNDCNSKIGGSVFEAEITNLSPPNSDEQKRFAISKFSYIDEY